MAATESRNISRALAVGIALVALVVGALIGWLVLSPTIHDLESRLAAAEARLAELSADETPTVPGGGSAEPTATPGNGDSTPPAGDTEEPPVTETTPAFVTGVRTTGGITYVTLDYIQFLTGDEAAAAAEAHGDESPPPNDYYIVNDNPQLREFPVDENIDVQVVFSAEGYSEPGGLRIPFAEWLDGVTGSLELYYLTNYYTVTVTDGVITELDQQYLP